MKKYLYKIAYPLAKIYWFIFRPKTEGVKVVIEKQDKILLVKQTYAHKNWTFPGGGVKRAETPLKAAIREVKEEVDLNINKAQMSYLGNFLYTGEYKKDTLHVFYAKLADGEVTVQVSEIKEHKWINAVDVQKLNLVQTGQTIWNMYLEFKK